MRIRSNHYSVSMALSTLPSRLSTQSCSRDGKNAIAGCSVSLEVPWIHSRILCFKIPILAAHVACCMMRPAGGTGNVREKRNYCAWKHCPENFHGNLCCVNSCSVNHCAHNGQFESAADREPVFKISNDVRCFWRTQPDHSLDLAVRASTGAA
jgi:hypothetical protein